MNETVKDTVRNPCAGPVERLATVMAERTSGADLAGALAVAMPYARPDGHHGHQVIVDPSGRADRILAEAYPWWAARGHVGIRIKRHRQPEMACRVLPGVLAALRHIDFRSMVPHWPTPTTMLALNRPDAVDLRAVAESSGADRSAVGAACLEFLDSVTAAHPYALSAMRGAGAPPLVRFPVRERYVAARGRLAHLVGADVVARLPDTVDDDTGRRVLFCDPKPANLMLSTVELDRWRATGSPDPIGVDLDLAWYDSSCALQAVIALFSAPLTAVGGGTAPAEMSGRYVLLQDTCRRFGADPVRVSGLVAYHLVRNFTHAVDGGDRAKATAFGAALCGLGDLPVFGLDAAGRRRITAVARLDGSAREGSGPDA